MICWEPSQLSRILKPDAESIQDHVFNAVHCPTILRGKDSVRSLLRDIDPNDFVDMFLGDDRENSLAVVLGDSGSGKSHLIQWLRLRVLERTNGDGRTLLLTVPRTGTSLRGILELLIAYLPPDEGQKYKERLEGTGAQILTEGAKVDRFLSELSHSLRHGLNAGHELSHHMADLFMDPTYREVLTSNRDGVVQLITRHVFESAQYRNTSEERREFKRDDLPLFGTLYKRVSENAQNAMDYIESVDPDQVVTILNSNLDQAIAQTLNFTADNLIDLMNKIRRDLRRQNRRLILLIEDFARLQGIDTALLQALITPNVQGEDELCELRWAMAVTTGYYERFAETVQTRLSLIVDMNNSSPIRWTELTKGYLNALRLGEDNLRADADVKSACQSCNRRDSCFKAFGDIDGVGLFPFTTKAIDVMTRRVSDQRLTPRTFLNDVLLRVLSSASKHVDGSPFPSAELLQVFPGGYALRGIDQQELKRLDPDFADHRIALLELWHGGGQIVNLDPELHKVFGIPPLRDLDKVDEEVDYQVDEEVDDQVDEEVDGYVDPEITQLQNWADNADKYIPQGLANTLRVLVYSALEEYIDWDRLGYKRSSVSTATGSSAFRQRSILFERQDTQFAPSPVSINIASNLNNSIALQALLLIRRNGNSLSFPQAERYLPTLFDFLTRIAQEVREGLDEIYRDKPEWSYANGAAEILFLTALQGGEINPKTPIEEVIARMFNEKKPIALAGREVILTDLNKSLVDSWNNQQSLIRNISSGTKGGVVGNFLRIEPILSAIKSLTHNGWRLSQTPPNHDQVDLQSLKDFVRLYRRVKDHYDDAVNSESSSWCKWAEHVAVVLGERERFVTFKTSFEPLMTLVVQKGIAAGNVVPTLSAMFRRMNMLDCDEAVKRALELHDSTGVASLAHIPFIVEQHPDIDQLIESVNTFMRVTIASLERRRTDLTAVGGSGLLANQDSIRDSLSQINTTLGAINQLGRS